MMLNSLVPSKKTVVIAASLGLAGIAGVCGCKSSGHESNCCQSCAPGVVQHVVAPPQQQAFAPQPTEPQAAPPVVDAPDSPSYEEPTVSSSETVERFEALGGVVELDSLNEIGILDLSQTNVGDADLQGGEGLGQLTQLDLSNTQITDALLSNPSWLRGLQRLSLNNTLVTDTGLASLKGLDRLQLLWVNETAVSDAGLAQLAGLTGIQSLGLNKTEVTDAGLVHLSQMKDLKYLLLGQTQVTDAGLQHLKGLTKLKGLSLVGCQVTAVGVAELQAALPDCQIVAETDQEQEEEESDANEDTRVIPRRLNAPGVEVRQALNSAQESPLPMQRMPGFADQGARYSADSVEITRYYIGLAYAETRNMAAALPLFAETVGEAAAYYNIGVMLCKAGYWDEGETQFRNALEINSGLLSARQWLSEIEQERTTIVSQIDYPAVRRYQLPQPVQVKSLRRTDLTPSPVGVWVNRGDVE